MNPDLWPIDEDSWPPEERPCVPGVGGLDPFTYYPRQPYGCCAPCCSAEAGWWLGQHCATHCVLGTERERDLTMPDTNETNIHRTREDYIR